MIARCASYCTLFLAQQSKPVWPSLCDPAHAGLPPSPSPHPPQSNRSSTAIDCKGAHSFEPSTWPHLTASSTHTLQPQPQRAFPQTSSSKSPLAATALSGSVSQLCQPAEPASQEQTAGLHTRAFVHHLCSKAFHTSVRTTATFNLPKALRQQATTHMRCARVRFMLQKVHLLQAWSKRSRQLP